MKPCLLTGHFGKFVGLSLLLVSHHAAAFGEQLQTMDGATLELLAYVTVGIFAVLLVGLVIFKLRLNAKQKQVTQAKQKYEQASRHLESFQVGMIHLDFAGNIQYANKVAAYYLGSRPEQLQGVNFATEFDHRFQEHIDAKRQDKVGGEIQLTSPIKQRELLVTFNPASQQDSHIATVVSISDVSQYQNRLDALTHERDHANRLLDNTQLGQLTIDLEAKQFTANSLFAEAIKQPESTASQGELKQLQDWIHVSDVNTWNQGLSDIQQKQQHQFYCRFKAGDDLFHARVHGMLGNDQILHLTLVDIHQWAEEKHARVVAQQHVKGLLSSNPNAAYLLDKAGRLLNCNSAFEKMFNTKLESVKGQDFKGLDCVPDNLKALHPNMDGGYGVVSTVTSTSGKECDIEYADGTRHNVRLKLQSYADSDGKRSGMVGFIEDISELRTAQKELDAAQQRFTRMLDMAPVAIATIDADDHVIKANATMVRRLGLSEKELKRGSFYQLFNDPINSGKAAKILHQTGKLHGFQAILKGNGDELHPSELHIDLYDKEKQEFLCWIADISDEKYQQDKFESLLQHSSMPMAVLSEQGFTQLNPAACEFFHIEDQSDLYGFFPYSEGLNLSSENAEELKQKVDQIKSDGRALSVVWQHVSGNETLDCQATYVPMYKGKDFDSILCIWADLRALKQADKERMEAINLHQAAQRLVAEKQQLLETSQDQLASQVKSLEDTKSQLQAAQVDLSEKQSEISDLQQAHEDMTAHLQKLQQDYSQSRASLEQSERSNAELEAQLQQTTSRVSGLEKQRNQIADALQYSEKKYQRAQKELEESEANAKRLEKEQQLQQEKMAEFVGQIDDLKDSIKQKDQQLSAVNGQINSLQSQLASSGQTSEKLRTLLINQRKASEQAEEQRRELEQACRRVQSELSNKARHIEHLQHEMNKFEEMSKQEKGDMEQQHALLQQELEAKQQQLQDTMQALEETKQQSEKEKAEKQQQQENFEKLQRELAEFEQRSAEQQAKMAETDAYWQQQQAQLQQELQAKQQRLLETEQLINEAKQQTEAERAEKARQQEIFAQLQAELTEMEQRSKQQQQQMEESDQQWQQRQKDLHAEVEAKQRELQETKQKLDEKQRLSDAEKLARMEQQQKLEQLKVELSDVELRAEKQKEMMHGSDEQWRQHHAEIEQQKKQLQQALEQAQQQNAQMKAQLSGSLDELKQAETQVEQTRSTEQKLQQELNHARQQAQELEARLKQQEEQELKLQQQLQEQQKVLQSSESNINHLQEQQRKLTEELQAVQQEYQDTQQNLSAQDNSQSELAEQLKALEQELQDSKKQLDSKESALQDAQSKLQNSQQKLAEQEQALVKAHKEELQQAKQAEASTQAPARVAPEFAKLDIPDNPNVWFDLLPYLQQNPHAGSMQKALTSLMDELEKHVKAMDEAVSNDDDKMMIINAKKLALHARKVNSEPLSDLASQLESDAQQGQVDNLSIFWPNMKTAMMKSLRVIYSHLYE